MQTVPDATIPDTDLHARLDFARTEIGAESFELASPEQTLRAVVGPADTPTLRTPASDPGGTTPYIDSASPGTGGLPEADARHRAGAGEDFARSSEYAIGERVGRGGMGEVFLAAQKALRRDVAIKRILPERLERSDSAKFEASFIAEALVTGFLDHPNIVPVHALGRGEDGSWFFSMKMVRGIEWRRLLHPASCKDAATKEKASARNLDVDDPARRAAHLEENLRILIAVCNAVAFAHSKHIIHRDLKPENVMVGAYGEVLVMDWGLAVDVSDNPPPPGSPERRLPTRAESGFGGTPSYMAPEQFAFDAAGRSTGVHLGCWTDVFLLGAMLSELLTGQAPYAGRRVQDVLEKVAECAPRPPENAPPELAAICRKALAKNPRERYPDALAFQKSVQDFLTHREAAVIAAKAEHEAKVPEIPHLARAVVLYDQALELWPEHAGMAHAAQAARAALAFKECRARWMKRSLYAAAASIVIGLTAGFFWIRAERNEAGHQMLIAEAKSVELADAKKVSDEQAKLLSATLDNEIFEIQDKLANHPGTLEVKKALLLNAMAGSAKARAMKEDRSERQTLVTHQKLGDIYLDLGDTAAARTEFQQALAIAVKRAAAEPASDVAQRDLAISWDHIGAVSQRLNDAAAALDAYQKSLGVSEKLAADPLNAAAQRDLALAHGRIGEFRVTQSDFAGALAEFRKAHALNEKLARDPNDAAAQRELAVSFNQIGKANQYMGHVPEALEAFKSSISIREKLAALEPENPRARRDLALAYSSSGDLSLQTGDAPAALEILKKGLALAQALAADDPKNAPAQRDLSFAYDKIGKAHEKLKDAARALEAYKKSLEIAERSAAADPMSATAKEDLSIAYEQIGRASGMLGDFAAALAAYKKSLDIDAQLAAENPNVQTQRGLSISYQRLTDTNLSLGDAAAARAAEQKSFDIAAKLATENPGNFQLQCDLAVAHYRSGTVNLNLGRIEAAAAAFQQAAAMREKLAASDPANIQAQRDAYYTHVQIGSSFQNAKEFKRAIEWYSKALDALQKLIGEKTPTEIQKEHIKSNRDRIDECKKALNEKATH